MVKSFSNTDQKDAQIEAECRVHFCLEGLGFRVLRGFRLAVRSKELCSHRQLFK